MFNQFGFREKHLTIEKAQRIADIIEKYLEGKLDRKKFTISSF